MLIKFVSSISKENNNQTRRQYVFVWLEIEIESESSYLAKDLPKSLPNIPKRHMNSNRRLDAFDYHLIINKAGIPDDALFKHRGI